MKVRTKSLLWVFWSGVIVAVVFVVYANLRTPYGNHIWIATGIQKSEGIGRFLYSRPISRMYLRSLEFQCEFLLTDVKEQVLTGNTPRYKAVPAMFVFYDLFGRNMSPDDDSFFTELTYKAVAQCDKDALLHADAPPPLIYAILTARVDFVEKMISNHVAINFTLTRPGKASDGMSPIGYARYLMNQVEFAGHRNEYRKIVDILETYAASV